MPDLVEFRRCLTALHAQSRPINRIWDHVLQCDLHDLMMWVAHHPETVADVSAQSLAVAA